MRTADTERPGNIAAQLLAGDAVTLVLTSDKRLRVKGEPHEQPVAAHEADIAPLAGAEEPIDALTAANRAKVEALRREPAPAGPVDLTEFLGSADGARTAALLLATLAVVILGAAARAGLIPGIAGLFAVIPGIASAGALIVCPCVWHAVAVPLMGLGLGIARGSRIAARKIGNLGAGRRLGRPCRAATALGALATVAGVVLALSAAWFAVPVGWI